MSGTIFFFCWISWIPRYPLLAISFFQTEQKHSSMAMRGPEGTSGEGSALAKPKFWNVVMAKPRLVNLVPLNLLSARKNFPQDVSDSNNPGNAKAEQGSASTGVWMETDAKHKPKISRVFSCEESRRRSRCRYLETGTEKWLFVLNKRLETNAECGHKHE